MDTLAAVRLVGMGELLRLMGVSRSRVTQITNRSDFPAPVASLIMGSVWDLADVVAWADARGRILDLDALAPPSGPVLDFGSDEDPQSKRKP